MINRAFGAPMAPWVPKIMTSIMLRVVSPSDGLSQKVTKLKIDAVRGIVRAYLFRMIWDGAQEAEI